MTYTRIFLAKDINFFAPYSSIIQLRFNTHLAKAAASTPTHILEKSSADNMSSKHNTNTPTSGKKDSPASGSKKDSPASGSNSKKNSPASGSKSNKGSPASGSGSTNNRPSSGQQDPGTPTPASNVFRRDSSPRQIESPSTRNQKYNQLGEGETYESDLRHHETYVRQVEASEASSGAAGSPGGEAGAPADTPMEGDENEEGSEEESEEGGA